MSGNNIIRDAPEPVCEKAYCGDRATCAEFGECLAVEDDR